MKDANKKTRPDWISRGLFFFLHWLWGNLWNT